MRRLSNVIIIGQLAEALSAPPPLGFLTEAEQKEKGDREEERTHCVPRGRAPGHTGYACRYLKSSMRDPKKLRKLLCRLM